MQKLMKRLHKNQKGFTLVELMVVVVIIGILVAIAIPIYGQITANAERRAVEANLRTIDGAIMQHLATGGPVPANAAAWEAALEGDFLAAWPIEPTGAVYAVVGDGSQATPFRAGVTAAANAFGTHGALTDATLPIIWGGGGT